MTRRPPIGDRERYCAIAAFPRGAEAYSRALSCQREPALAEQALQRNGSAAPAWFCASIEGRMLASATRPADMRPSELRQGFQIAPQRCERLPGRVKGAYLSDARLASSHAAAL